MNYFVLRKIEKTCTLIMSVSSLAAPYYKSPTGRQGIFYTPQWMIYGRSFFVKDLPIDKMTDVAYAFLNIDGNGRVFSGDPWADMDNIFADGNGVEPQNSWNPEPVKSDKGLFGQYNKLRKQGKKFNLALSIGGWTWSKEFSNAVSTDATRKNFIDSIVKIFQEWPGLFNGINIDWEYLSDDGKNYGNLGNIAKPEDGKNFLTFLKQLRATLGNAFKISLAVVAAPEKIKWPVAQIHPLIDELHMMTYDFHDGNWGETVAAHQTNLRKSSFGTFSVEEATAAYLGYGVPSKKIFIGATLYSRGFSNTEGIGKACKGGSLDKSWETGIVDYKKLPVAGAVEMWDGEAHASYSYDPQRKVLNSYDTVRSVTEKCQFVHENDLGGIIVWEASGDVPVSDPRSITKAIYENLTHGKPTNVPVSPRVIPTPPGGVFTPAGPSPAPIPVPIPKPSPPSPSPPAPIPIPKPDNTVKTYPCDHCSTCTKSSNIPCVKRSAVVNQVWKVASQYKTNDIVSKDGVSYKCLKSHTSNNIWAPPNEMFWTRS